MLNIKECPYCKSKEGYYAKITYSGHGIQRFSFDDSQDVDNGDMYDCLMPKYSKYYYCLNCDKRIGKVDEKSANTTD